MKKILAGFLAASAFAVSAEDVTIATVDVTAVNSPLTNTIIAVSAFDLGGGDMVVSNLVKTATLTSGDKLYAFDGSNYECWELSDGSPKIWVKADKKFYVNDEGQIVEGDTPSASDVTLAVGKGIWLSRQSTSQPIYIYGRHSASKVSTIAAGTTTLVGNPTQSSSPSSFVSFSGCAAGDKILVPTATVPKEYKYESGVWKTWGGTYGIDRVAENPAVVGGTGFWYVSKGSGTVTLNWE